ncbi:hypothetical protein COI97_17395 [Bacillus cereus]|nr:hypothetical protein COI97_17395 [Bacillus cereus]
MAVLFILLIIWS